MTAKIKHTPGPWKAYDTDDNVMHIGTISTTKAGWQYDTICNMYEDTADNYDIQPELELFKNSKANAKLIAAAPDLLEALQLCYDHCALYHPEVETNNVGLAVTKAIDKATK